MSDGSGEGERTFGTDHQETSNGKYKKTLASESASGGGRPQFCSMVTFLIMCKSLCSCGDLNMLPTFS